MRPLKGGIPDGLGVVQAAKNGYFTDFFPKMWKKVLGSGVLNRVGRVTLNIHMASSQIWCRISVTCIFYSCDSKHTKYKGMRMKLLVGSYLRMVVLQYQHATFCRWWCLAVCQHLFFVFLPHFAVCFSRQVNRCFFASNFLHQVPDVSSVWRLH